MIPLTTIPVLFALNKNGSTPPTVTATNNTAKTIMR